MRMKLKKVYVLCGPLGSGKSTYVKTHLSSGSEWISRDNIRFSLVNESEEYFSHEDEVFNTFINYINNALNDSNIHTIYIDATHLNRNSRNRTLNKIHKHNVGELNCLCFTTPRKLCQKRNLLRIGREKVPANVINKMYNSFTIPTQNEGFTHVYKVDENGVIKEVNF